MQALVTFAVTDGVGLLTLNRPERLNAVTFDMLDLIRASLLRAVNEGARAVLLRRLVQTTKRRYFVNGSSDC